MTPSKRNIIDELIKRINEHLQPTQLVVEDDGHKHAGHKAAIAGLLHLHVKLSSPKFVHLSPIECHRMVYLAVGNLLPDPIHALRITLL